MTLEHSERLSNGLLLENVSGYINDANAMHVVCPIPHARNMCDHTHYNRLRFSVAVNRKNGNGQKQMLWVRVNAWGKLADVAAQYVHKGSLVQVSSEWLRPSAWVDQSGSPQVSLDMDANRLVLLDRADNGDNGHSEEEVDF